MILGSGGVRRQGEERGPGQGGGVCREAVILKGRAAGREREGLKDFRNVESGWMWLREEGGLGLLPALRYLQALT